MRNLQKIAYTLDTSLRSKASVGLVALATDHVLEHEVGRSVLYNHFPGVGCYTTRIQNDVTISQKTLANMEQQLSGAVQSLLPGKSMVQFALNSAALKFWFYHLITGMEFNVIAFACTSASLIIGPGKIQDICQKHKGLNTRVTEPLSAAVSALKALNIANFALVTPYTGDINDKMRNYFAQQGLEADFLCTMDFNIIYKS